MAKRADLIGKKFGRLIVLYYTQSKNYRSHWWCRCDCGNELEVDANRLNRKLRQSCGCLSTENSLINMKKANQTNTLYFPIISTARRCWQNYLNQDRQCTLTFEQWYDVCQKNCFYCGIEPSNTFNCFIGKVGASQPRIDNGNFCYNGLDRIDSDKHHSIDNIVPCCWICNRAKHNRSVSDFLNHISCIAVKCVDKFIVPNILSLPEKYLHLPAIKQAYSYYLQNYGTMEIDLATFYTYSQMKCFYCNGDKSNCCQGFRYNGIDRVDSLLDHRIENIVPCCKWCNYSKGELSLSKFGEWVGRAQKYQAALNSPGRNF